MSENVRVLLVDDEEMIRTTLADYLEDEGFETLEAQSGEQGLTMLDGVVCCVVDMRLPGMNGNEFITRAHELDSGIKYLIYTGSTDYVLPRSLKELRLTDEMVHHKPVEDMSVLVDAVKALIGG